VSDLAWLEAGSVKVRGKAARLAIHLLVGDAALAKTPAFRALQDAHRDWMAGTGDIATCAKLAAEVEPRLARFYELIPERVEDFRSPA
jgi:hypothetical protein